jgi:hypothetical protein
MEPIPMAAKPAWYGRLDEIVGDVEALPSPWLTRTTVEFLLRVGPRRAQQIMAPCAVEQVGTSLVADRGLFVAHLRALAGKTDVDRERHRQRKLAREIEALRRNWLERPKLLVEAPVSIVSARMEDLPEDVELAPGRITIRFRKPQEALEKLLALAMAAGRDLARFEELTEVAETPSKE